MNPAKTECGRSCWPIATIVLLALVLRLVAAWVHPVTDRVLYPDAGDYDDLGRAIAAGADYRVDGGLAVRMPGYPLVIAAVYKVAGANPAAVLVLQAALGAATCWMVYRMTRRVSERAGCIAALLAAVDPLSVMASASLLSEATFATALVSLVWLAGALLERPRSWLLWIMLGLAGAVAVYLRASSLFLPAVLAAGVLAMHARPRVIFGAMVAVLIVVATLVPWKMWLGHHDETAGLRGLTSLEGISLYEAVYADATGGPKQDELLAHPPAAVAGMTEAQRDGYYRQRAWEEIRGHPLRIIRLAAIKAGRFWNPDLNTGQFDNAPHLWLWYAPLFMLAAVGMFCARLRRFPLLAAVAYFALLHMLYLGSVRYRVPLHPLLCMLAGVGLVMLFDWRKAGAQRGRVPSV